MAVLTHGVGVLPGHSHPHQQVGKGGHHQGGGGHSHHGDVVGGHRARLVVGGGHQHGPGGLQHNHSVDNFWWGWSAPHKSNQRQHVTIISKYSFCDLCMLLDQRQCASKDQSKIIGDYYSPMILNPPTGLSATKLIVYYMCTCTATTCQWDEKHSSDCKKCQKCFTVCGEPTNWILKGWYARCRTHHINRHYEWDSKQGQERSFYSLHIPDIYRKTRTW